MADATPRDGGEPSLTQLAHEMNERMAPRRARVLLAIERLREIEEAKRGLEIAEAKRRRFW
jgi:hypothetical protein